MFKNDMSKTHNIINRLERYAFKNLSGFTIEYKNDRIRRVKPSIKKHYCIGIQKPLIETYLNRKIIHYENFRFLEYNNYIGGYYDKTNELYIIELILILSDKQKSINTGIFYKQYSIYDLLLNKEIVLNEKPKNIPYKILDYIHNKNKYDKEDNIGVC
jgi:hypothetical protein